jgi:hypothetical protein
MPKIYFIVFFIFLLVFFIKFTPQDKFTLSNKYDKHSVSLNPNKITFYLKTLDGMNFVYFNNNFYITNQPAYVFVGELDMTGMYLLKNTYGTKIMTLNYNETDTSYSKIILRTPMDDNPNANTISNIFNPKNSNIYFDPVNKVIVSNDNDGNKIYLTKLMTNTPVSWNSNIDNGTIFEVEFI